MKVITDTAIREALEEFTRKKAGIKIIPKLKIWIENTGQQLNSEN